MGIEPILTGEQINVSQIEDTLMLKEKTHGVVALPTTD